MEEGTGLFLVCPPGLEGWLAEEAAELGLDAVRAVPGGVETAGGLAEAMRANLWLRGATRVLLRVAAFRAPHLAQLDRRARRVDWGAVLRADVPVSVEATCRRSRIYHEKAAAGRVSRAIAETLGEPPGRDGVTVQLRLEDDLATLSVNTSGEALHRRGHKRAVAKAPMRESMAALFLRAAGFRGEGAVLDPMCGAGTFPIEAAGIAAGIAPGRDRAFAFERLAGVDPGTVAALRTGAGPAGGPVRAFGSDRDAGAVEAARANAERAGVGALCRFERRTVSGVEAPADTGLVIANPPYGTRIGEVAALTPLYAALGRVLAERFAGWRVGIVTAEDRLARATGLALEPGPPVPHGGLTVRLWLGGPPG